jgi:hypothetical protein
MEPYLVIPLVILSFLAAWLIAVFLYVGKILRDHIDQDVAREGEETVLTVDVARLWIRVLEVGTDMVWVQFKFFRRNQLLDAGDLTLDFDGNTARLLKIFPSPDYPYQSVFKGEVGLLPKRKAVIVSLTKELERELPFGGIGFGW